MANYSNLRIFRPNLKVFFEAGSQKCVNAFIKEASDTHFARVYIIISVGKDLPDFTHYIYCVFSSFSTDENSRKNSLNNARELLKEVQAKLQKNDMAVKNEG